MNTPSERYAESLSTQQYFPDPLQEHAIALLQDIYLKLQPRFTNKKNIVKRLLKKPQAVKGLYLYGGVGIGKTWLMDIFFESLPNIGKLRLHFHSFMRLIHEELKQLQGKKNPLQHIAKQFAQKYVVLCFDEFFVSDITDAMLLAGLLDALFNEGITLVTTSNVNPDDLYKDGLQRDRFMPAIQLIKQHTQVLHMSTEKDYRLRTLEKAGIYYFPLNDAAAQNMQNRFDELVNSAWTQNEVLIIEARGIPTVRLGQGIVWFNFQTLCNIPRSQMDYLEIAKSFHTVLLSHIPQLAPKQLNEVLYLINLVDIFYDAQVKLIISAACAIEDLYQEGRLSFEFRRTKSRLQEMQTWEYLRKPHLY